MLQRAAALAAASCGPGDAVLDMLWCAFLTQLCRRSRAYPGLALHAHLLILLKHRRALHSCSVSTRSRLQAQSSRWTRRQS